MKKNACLLLMPLLILALSACTAADELPLGKPAAWPFDLGEVGASKNHQALWEAWQALEAPHPPAARPLMDGWQYGPGAPEETLRTPYEERPPMESLVDLPHRVQLPDQALWYARLLPEGAAGMLHVDADDGAQVFIDGREVTPLSGEVVQLEAAASPRELTVRVLNNAMLGGLRGVHLYEAVEYADYLERNHDFQYATLLVHRALQWPDAGGPALLAFIEAGAAPGLLGWPSGVAPFLAGPLLQQPTADSVMFIMEMLPDHPESRLLRVDEQGAIVDQVPGELRDGLVEYHLPALTPGSEVDYFIQAGDFSTPIYTLQVPDPTTSRFGFTAWADSQGGWPVFSRMAPQMAALAPAFSVGIGDLTSRGWQSWQWSALLACLEPLASRVPVFLLPGNHDYDGFYHDLRPDEYHRYSRGGRYRAWSYGPARFVALDPNASFPIGLDAAQSAWLERELRSDEWQEAQWRFVLIHQPPYSQGWPGYQGDRFIRDWVEKNAESAGIDFVLSGHTHDYERLTRTYGSQATTFFILGGAGGNLETAEMDDGVKMEKVVKQHHFAHFQVSPEAVEVQVLNLEGKMIDEYFRPASPQ